MIVGIHHTALSSPDLDRMIAFYRDLFGFEVEFDFSWDETNENFKKTHAAPETAGRVAMLTREGARLEVFEYVKPRPSMCTVTLKLSSALSFRSTSYEVKAS